MELQKHQIGPRPKRKLIRPYTRENLFSNISGLENMLVLDLGCGPHRNFSSAYLAHVYKKLATGECEYASHSSLHKRVISADIDYDSLLVLGALSEAVQADAVNLPFSDSSLDIVTSGWLLNTLDKHAQLDKALDEINRVLKIGGYFIGDVPLNPIKSKMRNFKNAEQISDIPQYFDQIMKYRDSISRRKFKINDIGIGFNSEQFFNCLAFYFEAQKF